MTAPPRKLDALSDDVKSSWHRFLDAFEPLRPELFRYCRALTHSAWDAEDLTQDALTRAFVTLGTLFIDLPNPRAWLFRVASNLWIDRVRRARFETASDASDEASAVAADPDATRDAGRALLRLGPQERVAVVLKDGFDFTLGRSRRSWQRRPAPSKWRYIAVGASCRLHRKPTPRRRRKRYWMRFAMLSTPATSIA
jgi:RNA polymerase sigma-70 factor (ECF subfamily)